MPASNYLRDAMVDFGRVACFWDYPMATYRSEGKSYTIVVGAPPTKKAPLEALQVCDVRGLAVDVSLFDDLPVAMAASWPEL